MEIDHANDGMLDLGAAMDLLCAENELPGNPLRSAGWRGGRDDETLKRYTSTIQSLTRECIDICQGDVIEIGTDYGLSAFAMSCAIHRHKSRKVITIDIRPETVENTRKRAEVLGVKNILFVLGTSDNIQDYGEGFSFGYIDGGHTFDHCYKDLCNMAPRIHQYGMILCHDAHYPPPGKTEGNGVRTAIKQYVAENPEWVAMRLCGFGLLGRKMR